MQVGGSLRVQISEGNVTLDNEPENTTAIILYVQVGIMDVTTVLYAVHILGKLRAYRPVTFYPCMAWREGHLD